MRTTTDPTQDRTGFYKGFAKIWQSSKSRNEAQRRLASSFPEEEITRKRMLGIRYYMVEKKGVPLKEIPADTGTDWDEVLSYTSSL